MKVSYDRETDSAYIRLSVKEPSGAIEVKDGFNVDTTEEGEIVGIEILEFTKKFQLDTLLSLELDAESFIKST
jgi:uncharacterized protein YuzE